MRILGAVFFLSFLAGKLEIFTMVTLRVKFPENLINKSYDFVQR